jgi:hypothetical protein
MAMFLILPRERGLSRVVRALCYNPFPVVPDGHVTRKNEHLAGAGMRKKRATG